MLIRVENLSNCLIQAIDSHKMASCQVKLLQSGAPFAIAKLVNITSKAMVYDTYNISCKYSFKFHKHTYWMV